jgi:hypothetical protein
VAGVGRRRHLRPCTGPIVNPCSDDLALKGYLDCRFRYPSDRDARRVARRRASEMVEHLLS